MKVFSNLAISVDGRIADSRSPERALGTPYDRSLMQKIRNRSDIIVVGASTLRVNPRSIRVRGLKRAKNRAAPANAVVTSSGDLDPGWQFWSDPDVIRFVFTSERGLEKARRAAADRAFIVPCGRDRVEIRKLLERLASSDYKEVLVEGGGKLIGSFLEENLLQELYVTHTPWILGKVNNPSLVENEVAFDMWRKLKPIKMTRIKAELYAHYKVLGAKRV